MINYQLLDCTLITYWHVSFITYIYIIGQCNLIHSHNERDNCFIFYDNPFLYSIYLVGAFLLELPPRHARDIQSEGATFGSLRKEFRIEGSAATNRWNRQEATRRRKLDTQAQQSTVEQAVSNH